MMLGVLGNLFNSTMVVMFYVVGFGPLETEQLACSWPEMGVVVWDFHREGT